MNHWLLVGLDILKIVKYFAPLIGSLIMFLIINNINKNENKSDNLASIFIGTVIAVSLYCWGMNI